MSTAHRYMSYTMDASGIVVRNHHTLILSDVSGYTLHETLYGWPENKVYWMVMGDCSRVGIAPLSDAAERTLIRSVFASSDNQS